MRRNQIKDLKNRIQKIEPKPPVDVYPETVGWFLEELRIASKTLPTFKVRDGDKRSSELVNEMEIHVNRNRIPPGMKFNDFIGTLSGEQQADLCRFNRDLLAVTPEGETKGRES